MGQFWQKAGDVVGAIFGSNGDGKSVIGELSDVADRFIETKADKKEFQLKAQEIMHRREVQAREAAARQREQFNARIKEMEGTAKDLLQAGWIGRVIIFLRGAQRPLWGYFVAYLDYMVLSKGWEIEWASQEGAVVYVINILVLGFVFGERAIKNAAPALKSFMNSRKDRDGGK